MVNAIRYVSSYTLAACLVRFKEKEYSVIEDNINFCVVIEKLCTNMDEFRVSVAPSAGTALGICIMGVLSKFI